MPPDIPLRARVLFRRRRRRLASRLRHLGSPQLLSQVTLAVALCYAVLCCACRWGSLLLCLIRNGDRDLVTRVLL